MTDISWFSDFTLVSGNYIIYLCNQSVIMIIKIKKNSYICFYPFIFSSPELAQDKLLGYFDVHHYQNVSDHNN